MNTRSLLPFVLAALGATPLLAQVVDPALFPGFDPGTTTRAFLAQAGPHWRITWSPERGTPALLFGGARAALPAAQAGDPSALEAAARALVDELSPALGFDAAALELVRVKSLAHLAAAGTSPKTVVKFRQLAGGVPVHHAFVNVVFDGEGRLLALDNSALPHASQAPVAPDVDEADALELAAAAFAQDTGFPPASFERGEYVIYPETATPGKSLVRATAAYVFKLDAGLDRFRGVTPVIRSYAVAATGQPRVLGSWSHVHQGEVSGSVRGNGQIGLGPYGSEPLVLHELRDVAVSGPGLTTTYTDDAGDFSITGVSGPVPLTFQLVGQWSFVNSAFGEQLSLTATAQPGVPASVVLSGANEEHVTAQVNAHHFAELFRDWLQSVDPLETTFDFQQLENVNIVDVCNAYYDGLSTNYFLAGGGCVNSAYSTVVWHEVGHWANDLFYTFNGGDGMGEGAADAWAMYIANDPVLAKDFYGPGSPIRTGLNTTMFCGDGNPACYGEVHWDGEPLMGALWKVRAQLQAALGSFTGGDVANHLLLGWFQAFEDNQIKSIIEEHWLVLDDDDGNLDNGTPHYASIDAGFKAQGFPGYVLPHFTITHLPLTAVNSEMPVPVKAVITGQFPVLSPQAVWLHWSSDGFVWQQVPLTPVGDDTWTGFAPGAISPAVAHYYLEVTGGGFSDFLPKSAPAETFRYDIGVLITHELYDFEPISSEGWSHSATTGTDEWAHGAPQGKAFDPPAAYSGARCWGTDLGLGTDGRYTPDSSTQLVSPFFNFTGKTGLRLRFQRWLRVEESIYDQAVLWMNSTGIYQNPQLGHLLDDAWSEQDIDIGWLADNNPSVQFKFALTSDPYLELGGWNIDDFRIVSLGPVLPTIFLSYGTGLPGTGGKTPLLAGSGQGTPGGFVTISVSNGKPGAVGAMFIGLGQANLPFKGGKFLVASPFIQVPLNLSAAGTAAIVGPVPPDTIMFGLDICHQYWCVDSGAVKGKAGSAGLKYTVQ